MEDRLVGKEFYLAALSPDDVNDDYLRWLHDPEVNKYLAVRLQLPLTLEAQRSHVASFDHKQKFIWGIYPKAKADGYIGTISLNRDRDQHQSASYGYLIGEKSYWGSKAALTAIFLILEFAFHELKLDQVWGGAEKNNLGSIFNFVKLGFERKKIGDPQFNGPVFALSRERWLAISHRFDDLKNDLR